MSSTPARRRRLMVARAFPLASCPRCGALLRDVFNPVRHLRRCEELAAAAQSEGGALVALEPSSPWRRFRVAIATALGIQTRGVER